jgi:GTP-binding protein
LADLRIPGQKVLVAKGGRGGLGNTRFATAVNQAPEIASKGAPGEKRHILIEVKLITDICIVGQPNSGKSTLLAAISGAKPEIADYPFTTRQPILGVMPNDRRDFIVAEIPGLVEGAHLGKGLGNAFLRHAERTRLLIYLLDGSSPTLIDDLSTLDKEIALYKGLSHKLKIVAVNKIDLPEVQARLPAVKQRFARLGVPVFYISAVSGQAVLELTRKAMEMVDQASRDEEIISQAQIAVFRPKPRK